MAALEDSCEVVLISGFLGAGKTTLLKNILNWSEDLSKTAIIVNEFGEIGIDGDLVQQSETQVLELTNGCICCSMQNDLIRTLQDLLERFQPTRVLIEASGVADPNDVLQVLKQSQFRKKLHPVRVITVIETDLWSARENLGTFIENQIQAADLVLVNKMDLFPTEAVQSILSEVKEICPSCSVIPCHYCQIDPEILWEISSSLKRDLESFHFHNHDTHGSVQEMGFVSFSFQENIAFRKDCFLRLIASLPLQLYRVKGYALIDSKRFFLNHVGGKTEWIDLEETGPTRLAFVGWHVSEQGFLDKLKACLHG